MDTGCPELVAGIAWLKTYENSIGKEFEKVDRKELFQFGNEVFHAKYFKKIPIEIGKVKEIVEVGIVDTNIPFLFSKKWMKEKGVVLDVQLSTIFMKETGETFKLKETSDGHLGYPLTKSVDENREEIVKKVLMIRKQKGCQVRELKKVHRTFGHPTPEKLTSLLIDSGIDDDKLKKRLEKIYKSCRICHRFGRKAGKPKVGLPKAREFNETIALDLKPVSSLLNNTNDKRQIVYMVDEFSRYTIAGISENKEAVNVAKIIMKRWCLNGPGYPSRGFYADNGGEFQKNYLEDLVRRIGCKIELGPSYSPWSNGTCERRHAAIDLTIKKMMEDNKTLDIEEALDHACWARNMEMGRHGHSPFQLTYGKSPVFPGVTDGSVLTDSRITKSEAVRRHFANQESARASWRQADASSRLKEALKARIYPYHDEKYEKGDKIIFLDESDQWTGPATVQATESKSIFATHNGHLRKVASCRAKRFMEEKDSSSEDSGPSATDDSESELSDAEDQTDDNETNSTVGENETSRTVVDKDDAKNGKKPLTPIEMKSEVRPKKRTEVCFKLNGDDEIKTGFVKEVGKLSGKQKSVCWIEIGDNVEKIDFATEVEAWDPCETINVTFAKESEAAESVPNDAIEVLMVNVPKAEWKNPEIQAAMQDEINKWEKYGAFTVVDDVGQDRIDCRWVINRKEIHDGLKVSVKARLCCRGFKEEISPRSDSPTVDRTSKSLFYAISANEKWKITSIDVTSAFLQGEKLDRELFVVPPEEANADGCLWKMNVAAYGLYDAGRRWWIRVVEVMTRAGCRTLCGDEACLYMRKNGRLQGIVIMHVDDFQFAGTEIFKKEVMEKVCNEFKISKMETLSYKYVGIDVCQDEATAEIILKQNDYNDTLKEVDVDSKETGNRKLNKSEFKSYRGLCGKLSWLADQTRPDLVYDVIELTRHNKDATIGDLKQLNKVVKKAKAKDTFVKYCTIGDPEDLKIVAITDGAYLKVEDKTKSVRGMFAFLTNKSESKIVPLMWKGKSIPTVCRSAKDAETRAAEKCMEESIYLASCVKEVYSGLRGEAQIPVEVWTDSLPLIDSINSTKQVESKLLRPLIKFMKQMMDAGMVDKLTWCDSRVCVADILTKSGAPLTDEVLRMLRENTMIDLSERFKKRK